MSNIEKETKQPRFRSVRYKLSHDLSLPSSSLDNKHQQITPFTSKNLNMRTTASRFTKPKPNTHHFSGLNFSSLRNELKLNTECPEDGQSSIEMYRTIPHENIFKRTSYIDTFNIMASSEKQKNRYFSKKVDNDANEKKHSTSEVLSNFLRVQLPSLNELDSQFMLLDHVNLPISFISEEVMRIEREIKEKGDEKEEIRKELKRMEKKINFELEIVQENALAGLERLNSLLKCNRIGQQETLLSIKSSLRSCSDYLPEFNERLLNSKEKVVSLQEEIFKGNPFELEATGVGILENEYF